MSRRLGLALALLLLLVPRVAPAQSVTAPAGTYSFTAAGPVTIIYGPTSITFAWGAPGPGPTPTPPPVPPTPAPPVVPTLTGEAWAMVIYDGQAIPPVVLSKSVRDYAETVQIHLDPVSSAEPRAAGYLAKAHAVGLPAVLVIQRKADGTGDVKHAAVLPADEAGFTTLLKQIRGKM